MKRVFVSYSFQDSELYIVTLLFEKLKEQGYNVASTELFQENYNKILKHVEFKIQKSDLFIGLITNNSKSINYVLTEWKVAQKLKIPCILIIEEGVKVSNQKIRFIRFNRKKPELAINSLFQLTNKRSIKKKHDSILEDILIVGGVILGIAAIITLLSNKKK